MQPTYTEFSEPDLVAIYDTCNPISEYTPFYMALARRLQAKTIVDIGCGTGLLTYELSKNGHQLIGVEPSNEMLGIAKARSYPNEVKWIRGDATQLGDFSVDLAIMTGHVAQFYLDDTYWKTALSAIYDAIKPGGYLAFESRNPDVTPFTDWPTKSSHNKLNDPRVGAIEWWSDAMKFDGRRAKYEIHYYLVDSKKELVSVNELVFRSKDEIVRSLEDAGFSVQDIYGDWSEGQCNSQSAEMIFVAQRQ